MSQCSKKKMHVIKVIIILRGLNYIFYELLLFRLYIKNLDISKH